MVLSIIPKLSKFRKKRCKRFVWGVSKTISGRDKSRKLASKGEFRKYQPIDFESLFEQF